MNEHPLRKNKIVALDQLRVLQDVAVEKGQASKQKPFPLNGFVTPDGLPDIRVFARLKHKGKKKSDRVSNPKGIDYILLGRIEGDDGLVLVAGVDIQPGKTLVLLACELLVIGTKGYSNAG